MDISRVKTNIRAIALSLHAAPGGWVGQQPRQTKRARECSYACRSGHRQSRLVCVFLQVYGASLKDPANACLVMELVKGGNLHQRIYDRGSPRLTHLEILQVSVPSG